VLCGCHPLTSACRAPQVAVRPVEEELHAASTASVPMYAWVLPSGGAASTTASAATTPVGAASSASAVVEAADGPSPMRQAPSPAAAPAPPPAASTVVQTAAGPMPMRRAPMSPAAAPASSPATSAAVLAADGPTPMQQWLSPAAAPSLAPGGQRCWSVLEVAQQVPSLADFAAALNATGLGGRAGAPSTVFAFTDAALDTVLAALQQPLSAVLARPAFIRQVVELHVVPGRALRAADLAAGDKLATLLGQSLTIARAGGTILVQPPSQGPAAAVVYADIPACGSVVHVIDAVLEPLAP
jgi:uncharacterized surface protein with fasciclin (FAS1) repeats